MLTKEGCRQRIKNLFTILPDTIKWALISNPKHITYFTGFWVNPYSSSYGEKGYLIINRNGPTYLIIDNHLKNASFQKYFIDELIIAPWYNNHSSIVSRESKVVETLSNVISELRLNFSESAVETDWTPIALNNYIKKITPDQSISSFNDLDSLIRNLRRKKLKDEIELIKQCIRIATEGHKKAFNIIKPGSREIDIYLDIYFTIMRNINRPILCYGDFRATNGKNPLTIGLPTNYKLKQGDSYILDFSIILNGYRCDFTNTITVGKPDKKQEWLFKLCCEAMKMGERLLKAGTKCKDVYDSVSEPFSKTGIKNLFPHHAGHGVGLEHPEDPVIGSESSDTLVEGDIITLEPGAYLEGVGGVRIENMYLIKEDGYEKLTNHELRLQ